MERLNMCMFASRVDYDAAVRRRWQEIEAAEINENNSQKHLTNIKNPRIIRTSLKQGAK